MKIFERKLFVAFLFIVIASVGLGLLITSCSVSRRSDRGRAVSSDNNDRLDRDRDRDEDDEDSERRRRVARNSLKGGGDCEGDDDCEDNCEDLFGGGKDEDDCIELSVNEVESMHDTFNERDGLLSEPDRDDLDDVDIASIEIALDIDENLWLDRVKDYSQSEAKEVLEWIAGDPDIINAVDDDDDQEKLLEDLFEELDSDLYTALVERVGEDSDNPEENFLYLAYDAENEDVIKVAHELLETQCEDDIRRADSNKPDYTDFGSNDEDKLGACALVNVYCHEEDDERIFDLDDLDDISDDIADSVVEFVRGDDGRQLNIDDLDTKDACTELCNGNDAEGFMDAGECRS